MDASSLCEVSAVSNHISNVLVDRTWVLMSRRCFVNVSAASVLARQTLRKLTDHRGETIILSVFEWLVVKAINKLLHTRVCHAPE